jgi:hypothetical protein
MNQGLVTKTVNPVNMVQGVVNASYNGINSDNTPTVTVAHKLLLPIELNLHWQIIQLIIIQQLLAK